MLPIVFQATFIQKNMSGGSEMRFHPSGEKKQKKALFQYKDDNSQIHQSSKPYPKGLNNKVQIWCR